MYQKIILDNGLRIVTERMPALKSVTVGIWVNVGSRDEQSGEEGVSHFLEHMFFKGTSSRSATDISREIDALGGDMNACTGREATTFYVKVLDQQLKPALALLSDLFRHSRFASKEIEKEKQVVLEEVRMVQDDPEDLVHELHMQQALKRHPLGRPILGQTSAIRNLRQRDLLRYVDAHYHPHETIISVAGNFDFTDLMRLLRKLFGNWSAAARPCLHRWPPSVGRGLSVHRKSLEQAHLCLGMKGVPIDSKHRYGVHALNAILGGSVSSRLFQEIREKRGLAYSIYSCASAYSDAGTLTVYAATRPREAARMVALIGREMKRLRQRGVERKELQRTKNQLQGNVMLGLESTQSRMTKLAKDELYGGRHVPLAEIMAEIDLVSVEQVNALAHELLDRETLSIMGLGPLSARTLQSALQ